MVEVRATLSAILLSGDAEPLPSHYESLERDPIEEDGGYSQSDAPVPALGRVHEVITDHGNHGSTWMYTSSPCITHRVLLISLSFLRTRNTPVKRLILVMQLGMALPHSRLNRHFAGRRRFIWRALANWTCCKT